MRPLTKKDIKKYGCLNCHNTVDVDALVGAVQWLKDKFEEPDEKWFSGQVDDLIDEAFGAVLKDQGVEKQ